MCTYLKIETEAAQNLKSTFGKNESFRHAELNERAEAATSSYSAEVDFLQHIYSVLVANNH